MAAFTAPHATPPAHTTAGAVVQTTQQRQEDGNKEGKREQGDMRQNTIQEKTHEFFQMCDIKDKGYITRQDMQRLNGELPLSPEELERVFDTLDSDANGYLTFEEFSLGFSSFVSGQTFPAVSDMGDITAVKNPPEVLYQTHWQESLDREDADEEQKHFCMLMERLGAISVFEDPAEVHSLWTQLRRDEPHLLSNFEDFLARVTFQIKAVNQEKWEMETVLQRKALTHDSEIQRLYEEMEQQIKNEKDKIALQDYKRFLSQSQDLELQLCSKEKELEQLFQKQRMLERQCHDLRSEQHVTKVENVKLKQTNDELTMELEQSSQDLILAQEQLSLLQEQSTQLHEEKEREIYRLTEGLQRERASLLKQLDLLREMNKHLRDERDMCFQNPNGVKQKPFINLVKQMNSSVFTSVDKEDEQITSSGMHNGSCQLSCPSERKTHLRRIISIEEDHLPHLLYGQCQVRTPLQECSEGEETSRYEDTVDLVMSDIDFSAQGNMEEGETQSVVKETSVKEEIGVYPPDRLFKIILVGNSSVGKTSLLQRFCDDCFHSGTSATVGIDYSVRTIPVDNSLVALQMWDTAGQERYRSITKQFFRKADAVVVMYDITSEQSFSAVRQWLTSVKESAGEDIPIMLVGNKTDKETEREVQKSVGERLAKNWQLAFFECSARSGHNVVKSMVHLARILKEQEDREKEKTVDLLSNPSEKKKSCC